MKKSYIFTYVLLLPFVVGFTLQEDDLVFDDVGENNDDVASTVINRHENRRNDRYDQEPTRDGKKHHHRVERLRGVPDTIVPVGHVFKMRIPRQAFSGNVKFYEVRETIDRNHFPRWLHWDDAASTLLGVPSKNDVGSYHLTVKAIGKHGDVAKDQFIVQVVPEKQEELKHKDGKTHCKDGEEQTLLTILLDARLEQLSPSVRVDAIENLAGFLAMHTNAFSMHPQNAKDSMALDSFVILSGPGNIRHRRENHITAIQWQVGCDGHLWKHQSELVKQLRGQAKDGTLAEVLQLPVISWHIKSDTSLFLRNRREIGSGDYDDSDYKGYDYDEENDYNEGDEEEEDDGEDAITQLPPIFIPNLIHPKENLTEHHHRHHHGEDTIVFNVDTTDEEKEDDEIMRLENTDLGSSAVANTTNTTILIEFTSPPSPSTTTSTTTMATTTTTQAAPTTCSFINTATATTLADTTTATVIPTIESTKMEITEESTEKHTEIEPFTVTILSTNPLDITTTPPPPPTTSQPFSTTGFQSSILDKVGTEIIAGINNVTMEEPTTEQTTTLMKELTTITQTTAAIVNLNPIVTSTTTTVTPVFVTNTTTETSTVISSTSEPHTTPSTTTTTTAIPIRTTMAATTTRPTTENIEYGVANFPPRRDKRLKKIAVTAGKPLSYIIPANTFSDLEDGDTRHLKLSLYLHRVPLKTTHWLQFNKNMQEVYGLPLEDHISIWNYELVATDSEGANVTDNLDIHVQQHKLSRSVNHEFSIYLRIDKRNEFPTDVDLELKIIRSLAKLYGDIDMQHITVRHINIDRDQIIFSWTNDSLPRSNECPREHIKRLSDMLGDDNGNPSNALRKVFAPEMRVKRVVFEGTGQCEDMYRLEKPEEPERNKPEEPERNLPPIPRNQVDRINATVGQLLVFQVPEDTFYDSEDGPSRNLKMSLLTVDRIPIPSHEWLQFDNKNQEFYGVPMHEDIGRKEYQLVVNDKEGESATDGIVVVVHPAPTILHTVEFSMVLDIPYDSFAHSALQKRNFIEKLRDLYGDKDTNAITLHNVSNGSTLITWYNRTLPTSYCPHDVISTLRGVLVKDDNNRRSVTDEVLDTMGNKFPVKQITVMPKGICLGELTGVHSPDNYPSPVDDSTSIGAFHDDYLITFVLPAIIIAAMLILAGIIACVLYKRRRSGKMSVSEQDDERQNFRSKGIPVIFQDELDEKPDPGNKSPIILKEEKPPLPPPEYQKTEDGADMPMLPKENSEEPYQPPPPFASNRDTNRQNRPKPTPTYRKPPPYVPP